MKNNLQIKRLHIVCIVILFTQFFGTESLIANASLIERLRGAIFYGNASWYGGKFNGRRTASGEEFSSHKLTAAHRTLPFGTRVRVTNTKNDKSVVVKVNDRGPFKSDRIIDISEKAANKIDCLRSGVAYVKVQVLEEGNNERHFKSQGHSKGRLRKFSRKIFLNKS